MARKHTKDEVLHSLKRKSDVLINNNSSVIQVLRPAKHNDLGNNSWGKIDYLKNVWGFQQQFVKTFDNKL